MEIDMESLLAVKEVAYPTKHVATGVQCGNEKAVINSFGYAVQRSGNLMF